MGKTGLGIQHQKSALGTREKLHSGGDSPTTSPSNPDVSSWPNIINCTFSNTWTSNLSHTAIPDVYKPFSNSWMLDSGSDCHIANKGAYFTQYEAFAKKDQNLVSGLNTTAYDVGRGTVRLAINDEGVEFYITLTNVLHVPNNHTNIVSGSRLMDSYLYLNAFEGCLNYHDPKGDGSAQRYCKPAWSHRFWWLQLDPRDRDENGLGHRLTSAMVTSASPTTWHQRLGHPSFNVAKKIAQRDPNIQIVDEQNLIGKHTIERSSPGACIYYRLGKST
jgi:hypothetical protein